MKELLDRHHISFVHAWDGIKWAMTSQPNFKIHIFLTIVVVALSWYVELSRVEFSLIVFAIVLGFSAEMINTAIESMTDLITTEWRQEAKIAKDVSAGMMLLVSFGALCVALVLILPKLLGT